MDQTTDQTEYIFQSPAAIAITKLGFRYGLRTGTPPTFKISLQGVDAAGDPNGTIQGGGSPASATFTPPADATWDGTWRWITLDNSFTTARGAFYAIVVAYDSGTIDGSNNSSFTTDVTSVTTTSGHQRGYAIQNNAGVRARRGNQIVFGYQSAGATYGFPMLASNNVAFGSGSTPDEYALRFLLPAGWGNTFRVVGVRWRGDPPLANDYVINLYEGVTVLQSVTIDKDYSTAPAGGTDRNWEYYFDEVTLSILNFGTEYRLGLQSGLSDSLSVRTLVVSVAGEASAFVGGTNFYLSTRTDAGSWTDVQTERPLMELVLADWTVPAGEPVGQALATYL